MVKNVIKRDGSIVDFNIAKIEKAVELAMNEVGYRNRDFVKCVSVPISHMRKEVMSVEEIQEEVETLLMKSNMYDVAKAYIRYRYEHGKERDRNESIMKMVKDKLEGKTVENSNANLDESSAGGKVGAVSEVVLKQYALDHCMSKMAKENHLNNEIYIHDLNSYAVGLHNCLTCPIDDLLANGFKVRQTDIRPANSVNTALQLVAVLFQVQSLQQFGGISAGHLDHSMVPYVRKSFLKHYLDGLKFIEGASEIQLEHYKDKSDLSIESPFYKKNERAYKYAYEMTEREIHQGVEGLYHNLNSLQSRSGNQLPFSSINYGTCTEPEGRLVTKHLLEVSIEGLGKFHRTSIFPCGIFQLKKGINRQPGDPNYDLFQLAMKSTSQRLYPNYANCDWSGNEGYDENDPRTYFNTMGLVKLAHLKPFEPRPRV